MKELVSLYFGEFAFALTLILSGEKKVDEDYCVKYTAGTTAAFACVFMGRASLATARFQKSDFFLFRKQ